MSQGTLAISQLLLGYHATRMETPCHPANLIHNFKVSRGRTLPVLMAHLDPSTCDAETHGSLIHGSMDPGIHNGILSRGGRHLKPDAVEYTCYSNSSQSGG